MRNWRSLLFIPAQDDRRLEKAHTRGADALVLDLEDAAPAHAKADARASVAAAAQRLKGLGQHVVVRINAAWRLAFADIEAAVQRDVDAIIVPKAEDPARLSLLSDLIGEWEAARRLPMGRIGVIALVETPLGLSALTDLARHPRTIGLALGPEDLSAALGAPPSAASLDLPCRMVALAAATRRLQALGLPASIADFQDLDAYAEAARVAKSFGMTGSLCIHPRQLEVLNQVFSPGAAEVEQARQILEAWNDHGGEGVASLDGRMIDRPVALRAERILQAIARSSRP